MKIGRSGFIISLEKSVNKLTSPIISTLRVNHGRRCAAESIPAW